MNRRINESDRRRYNRSTVRGLYLSKIRKWLKDNPQVGEVPGGIFYIMVGDKKKFVRPFETF